MSEKGLDEVYEDRNLLAAVLAEAAGCPSGWTPAPDEDGDEWAIVYLETPSGQVSWHVPRDLVEGRVTRNDNYDYDGHTRDMKNDRLYSWLEKGCWY